MKRGMKYDGIKDYTLDIDAIGIFAEKELTKMTYIRVSRGILPIVGHLAENGLVFGDDFREGNVSPGSNES